MSFHYLFIHSSFLQLSLAIFLSFPVKNLWFPHLHYSSYGKLVFKILVFCVWCSEFCHKGNISCKDNLHFAVVLNINNTVLLTLELFDSLALFLSRFFQAVGSSTCWKALLQYLFHWNWWFINTVCNLFRLHSNRIQFELQINGISTLCSLLAYGLELALFSFRMFSHVAEKI